MKYVKDIFETSNIFEYPADQYNKVVFNDKTDRFVSTKTKLLVCLANL
jgi:hypothetical protein